MRAGKVLFNIHSSKNMARPFLQWWSVKSVHMFVHIQANERSINYINNNLLIQYLLFDQYFIQMYLFMLLKLAASHLNLNFRSIIFSYPHRTHSQSLSRSLYLFLSPSLSYGLGFFLLYVSFRRCSAMSSDSDHPIQSTIRKKMVMKLAKRWKRSSKCSKERRKDKKQPNQSRYNKVSM